MCRTAVCRFVGQRLTALTKHAMELPAVLRSNNSIDITLPIDMFPNSRLRLQERITACQPYVQLMGVVGGVVGNTEGNQTTPDNTSTTLRQHVV